MDAPHGYRNGLWLLALAALLCVVAPVRGQTGPSLLALPWEKGKAVETDFDLLVFDEGRVRDNDDRRIELTQHEQRHRWRLDRSHPLSPAFGFQLLHVDIDSAQPTLPSRLSDASVNYGWTVGQSDDGWITQVSAGGGHASDLPYADEDGWYGMGTIMFTKQTDANTVWRWIVEYDGNRTYLPDIPLPGGAVFMKLDDYTRLSLGFPYSSLIWTPDERTRLEASFLFPEVKGRLSHRLLDDLTVYGAVQRTNNAFHVDGTRDHQRMFFKQRRIEAGMEWLAGERTEVVFAAGYAYDQEFSVGWDSRDQQTVSKISDTPYVRLGLNIGF